MEYCIACGEIIPEGRQVCYNCENGYYPKKNNRATEKKQDVAVVLCRDCKHLIEYSDEPAVERANGYCYLRLVHSCDHQFAAVEYSDYCSYGAKT